MRYNGMIKKGVLEEVTCCFSGSRKYGRTQKEDGMIGGWKSLLPVAPTYKVASGSQ